MTTTILTAIGVLLAGAAALMSAYYGGEAFDRGGVHAEAAQVMNAYHNIRVTSDMLRRERRARPSEADVMSRVSLPGMPGGGAWSTDLDGPSPGPRRATLEVSEPVCARINETLGLPERGVWRRSAGAPGVGCDASDGPPTFYGAL